MRKLEEKLVITFATTTQAMAMEYHCKEKGAPGRLIPVPKSITAGCGMAWCANTEAEHVLQQLMSECGIEPEKCQKCMV